MFYIYALLCPESGEVRYIGKAKNLERRLYLHIYKAKTRATTHHCSNWIRSLLNKGLAPTISIISVLASGESWQRAESEAIAKYRAEGHRLTNATSGGDGFHDMSAETIAKRNAAWRKSMSDPHRMARFIQKMNEVRNTPEVREKQSASMKARWSDPDKRATMLNAMHAPEAITRRSEATKRTYSTPEYTSRHSAKMSAIWNTPERKEEARQRSLKAWADQEVTAKRLASARKAHQDPNLKERMRGVGREIGARPEVKAIKSASMKAYAADPVRFAGRLATMGSRKTRDQMSASAKARFTKPGAKAYLSTPERRKVASESAKRRATPEYRAMMAEVTRRSWAKRKT